jgi:hypothetical protein
MEFLCFLPQQGKQKCTAWALMDELSWRGQLIPFDLMDWKVDRLWEYTKGLRLPLQDTVWERWRPGSFSNTKTQWNSHPVPWAESTRCVSSLKHTAGLRKWLFTMPLRSGWKVSDIYEWAFNDTFYVMRFRWVDEVILEPCLFFPVPTWYFIFKVSEG